MKETPILIVDFHAEATSEKMAMAAYLDGRATAVIGTHTHVPTADARVTARGTAAITDVGMTGPYASIIGVQTSIVLDQLIKGLPVRHVVANGAVRVRASRGSRRKNGPRHPGEGWLYTPKGPAFDAANRAYRASWGRDMVQVGVGGSIPFVALFGRRFGDMPLILNGVIDPETTAHGPNESLHLGVFRKAIAANVHLMHELGALGKDGVR